VRLGSKIRDFLRLYLIKFCKLSVGTCGKKNGIAGFHQPTDSNNGKKHLIKTILMSLIICNYRRASAKNSIFTTQFDYILMQFGVLNIRLGNTVITRAVVNDIMSLIVLP
jgi:hypothetical protein